MQCKDRYLYRLRSRNLLFGIWSEASGHFIGIRTKHDQSFLCSELSRDRGGSALPVEELEGPLPFSLKLNVENTNKPLFEWLSEREEEHQQATWDVFVYLVKTLPSIFEGPGWQITNPSTGISVIISGEKRPCLPCLTKDEMVEWQSLVDKRIPIAKKVTLHLCDGRFIVS